jgi:hypothetical protein
MIPEDCTNTDYGLLCLREEVGDLLSYPEKPVNFEEATATAHRLWAMWGFEGRTITVEDCTVEYQRLFSWISMMNGGVTSISVDMFATAIDMADIH